MNDFLKLIKSTGLYFFGNVLSKLIYFFLLPIYTKYLSPGDYGTYDVVMAYLTAATSILFFDIWNAVLRFMYDYVKKEDKYKTVYSGAIIYIGSLILYTISLLVCKALFKIDYFWFIFFYGFISTVLNFYSFVTRGFGNSTLFAVSGIVASFITAVTNIYFIVYMKMGYSSLFLSAIIATLIQIIMMEIKIGLLRNFSVKKIDFTIWKKLLFFALPLCINSLSYWLLSSFNRVAVTKMLSTHENGLYAVAGKFTVALSLVATCFSLAWQETAFSKSGTREEKGRFFSKASDMYLKALVYASICLIPAIWIIYPYFIDKQYSEGKIYIPLYVIGTVLSIFSQFLGNIFGNIMKTNIIVYSTVLGAAVNIGLGFWLIPSIGVNGANIAFAAGFAANIIMRIILLNKHIDLKVNLKFIFISTFLVTIYIIAYNYGNLLINFASLIIAGLLSLYSFRYELKSMVKLVNFRR